MSDITSVNGGIIGLIGSGIELGKPFSKEIFLVGAHIAGTTHIKEIETISENLVVGTKLDFYREPQNLYDNLAIVVKDEEGNKVGYIPRDKNEIIARLMDAGKLIYGTIKSKEVLGGWVKIGMEIYLKD